MYSSRCTKNLYKYSERVWGCGVCVGVCVLWSWCYDILYNTPCCVNVCLKHAKSFYSIVNIKCQNGVICFESNVGMYICVVCFAKVSCLAESSKQKQKKRERKFKDRVHVAAFLRRKLCINFKFNSTYKWQIFTHTALEACGKHTHTIVWFWC